MTAINNLRAGLAPPITGSDNHELWSDGAAMRIAPVGILCAGNPGEAARLAAIEAQVSHAKDGIYCAQVIAAGVAAALTADSWQDVVDVALAAAPPTPGPSGPSGARSSSAPRTRTCQRRWTSSTGGSRSSTTRSPMWARRRRPWRWASSSPPGASTFPPYSAAPTSAATPTPSPRWPDPGRRPARLTGRARTVA